MSKEYVWLSQELMDDYNDKEVCFGNKKGGYDSKAKECSKKECLEGRDECIALSKGGIPVLIGTKPELIKGGVEEPKEEVVKEANDTISWTRETVLEVVLEVIKAKGDEPEVVSTNTRDKVFIDSEDVFIVTKKALKVHRLEDGNFLQIKNEKLWKEDNKGIAITYDDSLDFKIIVEKALEKLYIESLPKPVVEKVKTDLFEEEPKEEVAEKNVVEEKVVVAEEELTVEVPNEHSIANKASKSVEVESEGTEKSGIGVDIEYSIKPSTPEFDLGSVVKVLKIVSYSNGYNEVSVISKASVEDILSQVKGILV